MDALYIFLLNAFMWLCMIAIIGLPISFVFGGGMQKFALQPLQRCFNGINTRDHPAPDDVTFSYHTYRGL